MWAYDSVFYHIYPLGFCGAPHDNDGVLTHSILKIADWAGHIEKLGADAMYLGPVFESDCHGYDTRDYRRVDCRLGTNEDLKTVCAELRKHGIRVIFDGVFNHVGRGFWAFRDVQERKWDSPYKDWFHINFGGNSGYNDGFWYEGWEGHYELVKLNLRNPAVADYIDVIRALEPFTVGGAEVTAFHTLHDTDESVGYRIEADGASFGFCTDLGCLTDEVLDAMSGVEAAVIESNYDEQMLCDGPYPVYLKRRILSDHGHLSNEDAGRLAVRLAESGARGLILGHLSRENNRPDKALAAVSAALAEAGESPELLAAPPLGAVYMEAGARCRA